MIKITESNFLKTCNSCGNTENTKVIEIGSGGAGAIMLCLCDDCQTQLINEIMTARYFDIIKRQLENARESKQG